MSNEDFKKLDLRLKIKYILGLTVLTNLTIKTFVIDNYKVRVMNDHEVYEILSQKGWIYREGSSATKSMWVKEIGKAK